MNTPSALSLLLGRPREGHQYWIVLWIWRHILSYEGTLLRMMQIHHSQWEQFKRGLKEKSPPSAKNYSHTRICDTHGWTELQHI